MKTKNKNTRFKINRHKAIFQALNKRLILLYLASTGLILAVMLCLTWLYSQSQAKFYAREAFLQLFSAVEGKVQNENHISHSWLGQLELQYHCNIYIEDNGHPFTYQSIYPLSDNRSTLVDSLKSSALENGLDSSRYPLAASRLYTGILNLTIPGGSSYLAAASQIASGENWQTIFVIQEKTPSLQNSLLSASYFLALFLLGLLLLYLISRILIRHTLAPVRESVQKQKEFIAAASHELRSPLAVLKMNLSAVQTDSYELPNVSEYLTDMEEEVQRMSSLIDDMLLLASLDADTGRESGWQTTLQPLSLDTFLIDLYEDFLPASRRNGLDLSLLLPDDPLPVCLADSSRLRQIFSILFDNAFCYAAAGKTLELVAEPSGKIALVDHGPGIPAEKRRNVFERFSRGDSSRRDRNHYGLGLSIAAELSELQSITLTCEETPGGGCTFVLRLPVA